MIKVIGQRTNLKTKLTTAGSIRIIDIFFTFYEKCPKECDIVHSKNYLELGYSGKDLCKLE